MPIKIIQANQVSSRSSEGPPERVPNHGDDGHDVAQLHGKKRTNQNNTSEQNKQNIEPDTDGDIEGMSRTCRIRKLKKCKITNLTINYDIYKND